MRSRANSPLLLLLMVACAPSNVVDLGTLGTPRPADRYTVRTRDTTFTLDHLQVDRDSVHGRTVGPRATDPSVDVVLARTAVAEVTQVGTVNYDLLLAILPFALAAATMAIFRAGFGSD